jgi:hypothetical protein
MADIINLRRVRKERARDKAAADAAASRAKHGRTGAEKERERVESDRQERLLDGARKCDE